MLVGMQRLACLLDLGEQARAAASATAASSRPAAPLEAPQIGVLAPNGSITPEGLVAAVSEAAKQILQNLPRSETTGELLVHHVLGQLNSINSIVPPPPPPPPPPRPAALERHVAVHPGFALQSLPSTPLISSAARSAHAGVSNQVVPPLAVHRSAGQQFASHSHLPVALPPLPTSCGASEVVVHGSVGTGADTVYDYRFWISGFVVYTCVVNVHVSWPFLHVCSICLRDSEHRMLFTAQEPQLHPCQAS